jgi:transposase InsO family protein
LSRRSTTSRDSTPQAEGRIDRHAQRVDAETPARCLACSPDNEACEGFFGRLKNELFHPRDWKNATIEQFIEAVDSDIRWYNEKRIKISLGSLSPIEYRVSLGLAA